MIRTGLLLLVVPLMLVSLDALADPAPDAIRTAAGCRSRVGRIPKRKRCIACVSRIKHHFHQRGAAAGLCHANGAVSPATVAAALVAVDAVRTVEGCNKRIAKRPKRERCVVCVKSGRLFQQQGAGVGAGEGFCRPAPGPAAAAVAVAATAIRTPKGCEGRIVRLPKRKRCMACVAKGHVFQQQGAGAGFCRPPGAAAIGATVAATAVRSVEGCNKRIAIPHKRKRCVACVSKGHIFQKQGGGAGFCRAPQPQPEGAGIRTARGCEGRIAKLPKRRRCIACVSSGRVFLKQGAGVGLCR